MAKKENLVQKTFRYRPTQIKAIEDFANETNANPSDIARDAMKRGLKALKITEIAQDGYIIEYVQFTERQHRLIEKEAIKDKVKPREIINRIVNDKFNGE